MKSQSFTRAFCVLALLLGFFALVNCGTGTKLEKITVTPANPTMAKGTNLQLTAMGSYSDGNQQALTDSVAWQSAANVAQVSDQGQVTAMAEGSAQISASYQGVTGSTYVTIGAPALVAIAVSPNPSSLPVGESEQLAAVGTYSDGTVQDVTQSVTWSSSPAGVASITSSGMANGLAVGKTTVVAASANVQGAALLSVGAAVLTSISVTPGDPTVPAGDTQQFIATGNYSDGSTQDLTASVTWSSPAPGVATITSGGLATGIGTGTTTISAAVGNISGSTALTVSPAVLVSVAVTPGTASIISGNTQQFTAIGTYSNGSVQNLTASATWTSLAAGVASVNPAGLATGLAAGAAAISASVGGLTGSASLSVAAPSLVSIAVTPGNVSIAAGGSQQFTATGTYNNGTTQDLTSSVTWSSSLPKVAAIGSGLASAAALGQTTITASSGSISGSATMTVTAGFVLTGPLNTARQYHTATLLNNGLVLIAGGFGSSGALASAELYNPVNGTFMSTGSLNTARGQHTATLLQNGTVLILGGTDGNSSLASAEIYNPATATFTPVGSLNTARAMHSATVLPSGMVLVCGGIDPNNQPLASAELYNPYTGTFTSAGNLNVARSLHTAALLNNGQVLLAGGNPQAAQTSAELYDPSSGTFTSTGNLNAGRYDHTATLLNDGTVLIAGGTGGNGAPATAELYDATTGMFTPTGSLSTARFEHTASLLNNGTVLIAGGFAGNGALNSAELYDPASGTFSLTGSLSNARYNHAATLLNNGMTLITGGFNEVVLAGSEFYEPTSLTPPNLVSISVSPANPTVPLGAAQPMVATGTFSDNSTQQLASVTWSSSNSASVATTNDATDHGAAYAAASGSAVVTACAGSVCGSTPVTVGPPALLSIAVTPANSTVPSGYSVHFSAVGSYTDGSTQSLTNSATWNSSSNTVTITPAGLATGWDLGVFSITATVGSITGTATLTVSPAVMVSLSLNPTSLFMSVGTTLPLQVIGNMSDGSTPALDGGNVSWSVGGPPIATVDGFGNVTALQNGTTSVVAQSGGFTATANVTIAPVASVQIIPAAISMAAGTSTQLHAIATLSDGRTEDVTNTISWSSAQPSIASVSAGMVSALQVGAATITAQGSGFSGSASLNVLPVASLNIFPTPLSLVVGATYQLRAIATLSDGSTEDVTAIATWSSDQANIVSVNSGMVSALAIGSSNVSASANGVGATDPVTVVPLVFVSYFNRANAVASGIDGTLRIANPGVTTTATNNGSLCAMIYVFDQSQELNECCGCSISDGGLLTLSLLNDLTANPLRTPPNVGTIMVIPSDIRPNPQCDPSSLTPYGDLSGSETNDQPNGDGTFQVSETSFSSASLSSAIEANVAAVCSYLENQGSGAGICSCGGGEGNSSSQEKPHLRR